MNLAELSKMQTGCGFKHKAIKRTVNKGYHANPKEENIEIVIGQIESTPKTLQSDIIKATGLSEPCVRACLVVLMESADVVREYIRHSGPFPMYSYSVAK